MTSAGALEDHAPGIVIFDEKGRCGGGICHTNKAAHGYNGLLFDCATGEFPAADALRAFIFNSADDESDFTLHRAYQRNGSVCIHILTSLNKTGRAF